MINKFYFFFSITEPSIDVLLDACHKLKDFFHYPWELMPLLYAIVHYAKGDIEEAKRKINEGLLTFNFTHMCYFYI